MNLLILIFLLPLSLEEVIKNAIKNNFDILIAEDNLKANKIRNNWAEAGIFPNLNAGVSSTVSPSNSENLTSVPPKVESFSINIQPVVELNWTLFNGLKLKVNKKKLEIIEQKTDFDLKNSIANVVNNTINQYYSCVLEQKKVSVREKILSYSKEKYEQAIIKFDLGKLTKYDVIQSKSNLLKDSIQFLNQKNKLKNSLNSLKEFLVLKTREDILLTTELNENFKIYDIDSLNEIMLNQNFELKSRKSLVEKSILDEKLSRKNRFPKLNFRGFLNYSNSYGDAIYTINGQNFSTDFKELSKSLSYGATLNLTMNIFNGFYEKRNIQQAIISHNIAENEYKKLEFSLQNQLEKAFNEYEQNLKLLELKRLEIETNEINYIMTEERLSLGTISIVEFRTVQTNLVNAELEYYELVLEVNKNQNTILYLIGSIISNYNS